jgi:hypothetical protein
VKITKPLFVLLIGIAVLLFSGATKDRDWQSGTLIDVSSQTGSRLVGTINNGQGDLIQRRNDATFYQIQTPEFTYVAKRTLTIAAISSYESLLTIPSNSL